MRTIQKIIHAGFAAAALASASVPALAWTVWPDVDFEWYANVGKPLSDAGTVEVFPAPREGQIWAPGHYERRGTGKVWVEGRWIADDFPQQVAIYNSRTDFAQVPPIHDVAGNPIPMRPDQYPIDPNVR
jgi:hypothetical protein